MIGLPLLGDDLSFPSPRSSFMDLLNDPNASLPNLDLTPNLNLTVEDVMNPENDEETRLRHRNLAKRQMPYIENYFVSITETLNTMAGIHINRRTGLGFLLT